MTAAVISEYGELDATALADLMRRGEVSSLELLDGGIRRLEQVNGRLNAVTYKMYDYARASAAKRNGSGRFAGVPFLMKDFAAKMAGFAFRGGSRFLQHNLPEQDSEIVRRFAAAGLITFGKTNLPEFAIGVTTEPQWMGATHNLRDLTSTPGRSSSGSAARDMRWLGTFGGVYLIQSIEEPTKV